MATKDRKLNRYETPFAKGAQSVTLAGITPADAAREVEKERELLAKYERFTPEWEYHHGRIVALELRVADPLKD